jgi:hypothetical protein
MAAVAAVLVVAFSRRRVVDHRNTFRGDRPVVADVLSRFGAPMFGRPFFQPPVAFHIGNRNLNTLTARGCRFTLQCEMPLNVRSTGSS